ncbi:hypothetical protein PV328_004917 [Microctonus aethiopoides]|uniref:Uncharacterized protein n=1 Tax=Microctonus aethiopoides TaxID=144406 RepID=A0AA39FBI0_9HYME|nr:hypothetical protein PV328_004917 [Microctonus aethiopoides]
MRYIRREKLSKGTLDKLSHPLGLVTRGRLASWLTWQGSTIHGHTKVTTRKRAREEEKRNREPTVGDGGGIRGE